MTDPDVRDRDDRGVATIFLILALTAIFAGAGLAIDVGQYVVHARSAQNSADATALAVATDCALSGSPIADYSPYRKDGQTITTPACQDGAATITVTKDVEGLFLPSVTAGAVNRTATARWGTLVSATAIPLTIADCEFDRVLFGDLSSRVDDIIIYTDTPPPGGCSSPAGGFGMLDAPRESPCEAPIIAGETASGESYTSSGNPGNKLKAQLVPCLEPMREVLIPIYDTQACEAANCKAKGNGAYSILGFAMFRVTGYSFGGNSYAGELGKDCPDQQPGVGQLNCISGDFLEFLAVEGTAGPLDPNADFGVYRVYLSS
jgi:hypothetical protein